MNSVLNNSVAKDYPKLMRHKPENVIVLLHKQNCGMVVNSCPTSTMKIGYYSTNWTETNNSNWEDYTGVVSLSN